MSAANDQLRGVENAATILVLALLPENALAMTVSVPPLGIVPLKGELLSGKLLLLTVS